MKKFFQYLVTLIALPLLIVSPVYAQQLAQGEHVVLEKSQVVNKDYFAAGGSVTVSGTVNGDAYLAGGNILMDGTVNGDLLVAGGSINIIGPVRNNIRVFGGNITINSVVGGNVTVGAGNVQITSSAKIGGGLVGGAGNVSVLAPVARGVTMGVGQLHIANTVGGDIAAGVNQLSFDNGARVGGNVTYWSDTEARLGADATVAGQLVRQLLPKHAKAPGMAKPAAGVVAAGLAGVFAILKITELVGLLALGLVMIRFIPVFMKQTVEMTEKSAGKAFLVGLVTVIVLPILTVILFVTFIGVPFAVLAIAATGILLILSKVFTSLFVGTKVLSLLKVKANMYWAYAAGLLIMTILLFVPILGWLVAIVLYLMATGGILLTKAHLYTQLRTKELI